MLLIVTGATQSGKSTALERIVRTALQDSWAHAMIVNGKTGQLMQSAESGRMRVTAAADPAMVAQALTAAADRLTARCAEASARPGAAPARELLIIDEIQEYSRPSKLGTTVRSALVRIFERSAVLGDVVILASQRATGAIPPGVRVNAGAELRMLGSGHFQIVAAGLPTRQGRVDAAAPLAPARLLSAAGLAEALCGPETPRAPTLITRYEGPAGSGRTYALNQHQGSAPGLRRVYLDARAHTHKGLIVACLEQCGAVAPEGGRVSISELVSAAAVALQAAPSLLLIDNCDELSARAMDSVQLLLDAPQEAAISLAPPPRNVERDHAAPIRRRAALVELQPLDHTRAAGLARQIAPSLDQASAQAVVQSAAGNPQAVVAFAERVAAHGADERHRLETARPPSRWLNLLLMFAVLVVVILIQRSVAHDLAGAVLSAVVVVTMWLIRPRFSQATRA